MRLLAALALIFASSALCQELRPYPKPRIKQAQWQSYFDEVKAKHGPSARVAPDQRLVVFDDPGTSTSYAFTQPGHPAYPAWIARKAIEKSGKIVFIDQVGYFAGAEAPFAALFKAYAQLNERIREDMSRR